MVVIVQLVRASDCGSECRGFESHYPPEERNNCFSLFCLWRIAKSGAHADFAAQRKKLRGGVILQLLNYKYAL